MKASKSDIKKIMYLLVPLLLLNVNACSDNSSQPEVIETVNNTVKNISSAVSKQPLAKNGTIKAIKNAGGYSYIQVDISGEMFWLATAISHLKTGEKIAWKDHAVMKDFSSKALNQKFDQILFVDRVLPLSALASNRHQGKVIETMVSAGYSYIHVEEKGNKIWLAAPSTSLQAGQMISWESGAAMRNFSSKTLQRTFDEIYFVNNVSI